MNACICGSHELHPPKMFRACFIQGSCCTLPPRRKSTYFRVAARRVPSVRTEKRFCGRLPMLPLVHSVKPFPRGEALGCVHFSSEVGSVRDPALGASSITRLTKVRTSAWLHGGSRLSERRNASAEGSRCSLSCIASSLFPGAKP